MLGFVGPWMGHHRDTGKSSQYVTKAPGQVGPLSLAILQWYGCNQYQQKHILCEALVPHRWSCSVNWHLAKG